MQSLKVEDLVLSGWMMDRTTSLSLLVQLFYYAQSPPFTEACS